MGEKGAKLGSEATQSYERIIQALQPLGDVSGKKMFGGYGVFESGTMFALVTKEGGVYLKSGDANLARFESAGANKHGRMPYYRIPDQVLEDDSQLFEWAQEVIEVSKAAKK